MELYEFIFRPENSAFFVSITIMLIMAAIEFLTMLIGVSISEAVDNLLPDFDLEADVEAGSVSVLDWLNFGRVPFVVLLILFLTLYGLCGFILQGVFFKIFETMIPLLIASLLTLIPTVILVHFTGRVLSRILPQVETTAVTLDSLVGRFAEITLGTATKDFPAEARVKDKHGKVHYVRVVPENQNDKLVKGDKLVLLFFEEGIFKAEKVEDDFI